jgi:hypothetical protein
MWFKQFAQWFLNSERHHVAMRKKLVNINIACTWVSIPLKYRKNVMRIGFSLSPHHACFFPVAKSIIPDSRACLLCMGCFSFSRCIAWWDRVLPSINSHGILIQHVGICAWGLGKFDVETTGANLWVLSIYMDILWHTDILVMRSGQVKDHIDVLWAIFWWHVGTDILSLKQAWKRKITLCSAF